MSQPTPIVRPIHILLQYIPFNVVLHYIPIDMVPISQYYRMYCGKQADMGDKGAGCLILLKMTKCGDEFCSDSFYCIIDKTVEV